jgi:hypothetical protein
MPHVWGLPLPAILGAIGIALLVLGIVITGPARRRAKPPASVRFEPAFDRPAPPRAPATPPVPERPPTREKTIVVARADSIAPEPLKQTPAEAVAPPAPEVIEIAARAPALDADAAPAPPDVIAPESTPTDVAAPVSWQIIGRIEPIAPDQPPTPKGSWLARMAARLRPRATQPKAVVPKPPKAKKPPKAPKVPKPPKAPKTPPLASVVPTTEPPAMDAPPELDDVLATIAAEPIAVTPEPSEPLDRVEPPAPPEPAFRPPLESAMHSDDDDIPAWMREPIASAPSAEPANETPATPAGAPPPFAPLSFGSSAAPSFLVDAQRRADLEAEALREARDVGLDAPLPVHAHDETPDALHDVAPAHAALAQAESAARDAREITERLVVPKPGRSWAMDIAGATHDLAEGDRRFLVQFLGLTDTERAAETLARAQNEDPALADLARAALARRTES